MRRLVNGTGLRWPRQCRQLADMLAGWQAGRLAGWQACRLAGWQAGRLAGWQAGRLASLLTELLSLLRKAV